MTRSSGTSRACAAGIGWRGAPPVKATRGATLSTHEIWLQQLAGLGQMVPQRPLHRRICQSAVTGWAVRYLRGWTAAAGCRGPAAGRATSPGVVQLRRAAPAAAGHTVLAPAPSAGEKAIQVLLGSASKNSSQQVTSLMTCAVPAVTLVNAAKKSLTTSAAR